ncbi:MAG TPA: ABC transporter permease, partial [Thermoanaerobaculia bacterium]|nr:ABC transporter permease [Thermoanaerobaculia bacterium]
HLVNLPLLFTSTALVPGRHLPDWLAGIARWNPLTLAVEAWRGALLAGEPPSIWVLALLALLCAGLFLLARASMQRALRQE